MGKKVDPTVPIVLVSCADALSLVCSLVPLLSLIGLPLTVVALVFKCMFLHQAWSALPESARSTSPGKAVGFLFIPFFNFYWYFRAYVGLVDDTQKYTEQPGPRGLATALSILSIVIWFVIWFPWVGTVFAIATYVVWLLFVLGAAKHANAALAKRESGSQPALDTQAQLASVPN